MFEKLKFFLQIISEGICLHLPTVRKLIKNITSFSLEVKGNFSMNLSYSGNFTPKLHVTSGIFA